MYGEAHHNLGVAFFSLSLSPLSPHLLHLYTVGESTEVWDIPLISIDFHKGQETMGYALFCLFCNVMNLKAFCPSIKWFPWPEFEELWHGACSIEK